MADIRDLRCRADLPDDAFHRADETVLGAKISE